MRELKKILTHPRVILLILFLLMSVVAIAPNPFHEGVAVRTVEKNSSASLAGMESAKPTERPMSREIITAIDNKKIKSLEEYYAALSDLSVNQTLSIRTNRNTYTLFVGESYNETLSNETEEIIVPVVKERNVTINGTTLLVNVTENETRTQFKVIKTPMGVKDIGLGVYPAPSTNIKKGLDLQGGTRVLLKPETELNADDMDTLIANMEERLNVYGLSDIVIREARDRPNVFGGGNQYIIVEIAGATEEEVSDLLSKQGKFEAKIGNETVFRGGDRDITYVCRSADCSGIDVRQGCGIGSDGNFACRFRFAIALSAEAAKHHADVTRDIPVVTENGEQFLEQRLTLYLDDEPVDELRIGADLKGQETTDVAISGSGIGISRDDAMANTLNNMKRLQTILITGSLPVKLEIVRIDSISPLLGEGFVLYALFAGLASILTVSLVIWLRYKRFRIAFPIFITMLSEVVILLGFAAFIGWNLDLAAVAGIIVAVGTGVDDQVVITDESTTQRTARMLSWKDKLKRAFFIIFAAYFTTVVAMVPLLFAGAGLLKGFALVTIFGVSAGVLVTRPAFAAMIEILMKD
ncbi:hypothetical protein J4460_05735 [Candidatus Woesearchaeota archaeon]|nr:MAG: hypothetical protein QS99_C0016G0031 [archaeon GW2011_AR4]MBS3130148.1 hypothetical protein [Candidatus Woesearchaeota archaeon]HIH38979.1 hypothetical protein [Candidatus Woesearchaeota archaeon]HIH49006.1 hypothetical protein [Candidatus Woesearchaeota archaeon]HIJ04103.1 hypothetical protein [Candidatus Woesearchaeota archaeon]